MTIQCNLKASLTLDKVNSILDKLYNDQESNPSLSSVYTQAIKHYQAIKLSLQNDRGYFAIKLVVEGV